MVDVDSLSAGQGRPVSLDLAAALKAARMAAWAYDPATGDILRSPELNTLLLIPPQAQPSFDAIVARLMPGERKRIIRGVLATARRHQRFFRMDFRIRRFDGEIRWFLLRAEVFTTATGGIAGVLGVLIDLTERKHEEQENAYLASVVASMPYAVTSIDSNGRIRSWNDAAISTFGYTKDEITGLPFDVIVPPDERDATWKGVRSALAGLTTTCETKRLRRNGTLFDAKVTWAPVRGPDLSVVGVSALIEDLTEAKQIAEHQRLLVRELHHRVRNTLATVQGIAGVTARVSDTIEDFRESFAGRIAALARTHTRLTEAGHQTVKVADLIDQDLGPFVTSDRVSAQGPSVDLTSEVAPTLAMAVHELATNAVRHGSLNSKTGRVDIVWRMEDGLLRFDWTEEGPVEICAPTRKGFGSTLFDVVLPAQFGTRVERHFGSQGIHVVIRVPLT